MFNPKYLSIMKNYLLLALAAVALCFTACKKDNPEPTPVAVTGISLDKTMVGLEIGESATVQAVITPSNATNKAVEWSVADTAVATVANGVVTGVAVGETTLTATTADGGFTATIPVKVVTEKVAVTGIVLTCPSNIEVGDSATLTVQFFPLNATNHSLSFVIDNPECVKISYQQTDDNRVMYSITGVQDGIVKIKAVSEDGGFESNECAVMVAAILPTGVTFDGKTGLSQENIFLAWHGKVVDLKAKAEPEGASLKLFFWGLDGPDYDCAPVWKYNITDDKATISVVLPEDEQSPQDVRTTVVAKLSENPVASAKAIIVSRCCFWCYRSFSDGNISNEADILHFGPEFFHKNEYFRWDATGDRKFANGWYFVGFCPPISESLVGSSELYYKDSYIPADEYTLTSTSKNIKITKMENVCYKVERTKWDAYEEFTLTYTCGEYVYNIPCRLIP